MFEDVFEDRILNHRGILMGDVLRRVRCLMALGFELFGKKLHVRLQSARKIMLSVMNEYAMIDSEAMNDIRILMRVRVIHKKKDAE